MGKGGVKGGAWKWEDSGFHYGVRGRETARSWLHPRWVPVGPSRGSAAASVSGVEVAVGGGGW